MENVARWFLAQLLGLTFTVLFVVLRDQVRGQGAPFASLGGLLSHYGPQLSAYGLSLSLWALTDFVFRAAARDRQWLCAGSAARWIVAALLYLLCLNAAVFGLAAIADPASLARTLTPDVLQAFGLILLGTALLSLIYAMRLDFISRKGQVPRVTGDEEGAAR